LTRSDAQQGQTSSSRFRDASRIGAHTDGVFAIAMTLLVLDLELPDAGPPTRPGGDWRRTGRSASALHFFG
jgi:hypothetical protein